MLSTRIRTTIIALVAAGSIIAGSVAPQADAAGKTINKSVTHSSLTAAQIGKAKPSTKPSAKVTVAIWITKFGTGPATCYYSDGTPAGEGEEATVMVFDNGTVVSFDIVCGADGQWHAA